MENKGPMSQTCLPAQLQFQPPHKGGPISVIAAIFVQTKCQSRIKIS